MKLLDVLPIFEARSNSDNNTKLGLLQELEKYKNDPNIFIHFTDIQKLGINPNFKYSRPMGIYGYNLQVYLNSIRNQHNAFATQRKYVYVFKPIK
jgi:hypothetical protein